MELNGAGGPQAQADRVAPWFRRLALASVLSTFVLVVLGAVVRVTGSGLGCPDWPLCHGGVLPPAESKAIIEYSHRVVASFLVGPLVLATVVSAWILYRRVPWLVAPATVALVMLVAQAVLGGVTVVNELPGALVTAHLALGEALLACLVLIWVVASRGALHFPSGTLPDGRPDRFPSLMLASGFGIYLVLLSGSYVSTSGATGACLDWPHCLNSDLLPGGELQVIHMAHRFVAVIIGVFVIYVLHLAIRGKHRPSPVRRVAMAIVTLFLIEILIGAGAVWMDFPTDMRGLHQAVATAVWGMAVWLTAVNFTSQTVQDGEPANA